MSLVRKPFQWSDRLFSTKFFGRPYIFSAQDMNRYLDSIKQYQSETSDIIGAKRDNFHITFNSDLSANTDPLTSNLYFYYRFVKNSSSLPATIMAKGVKFVLPDSIFPSADSQGALPIDVNGLGVGYFILTAKKVVVSYDSGSGGLYQIADVKAFSGVSGSPLPTSLPSSENVIYADELISFTYNIQSTLDSLTSAEPERELICYIATVRPNYVFESTSINIKTVDNPTVAKDYSLVYNALNLVEFNQNFPAYKLKSDSSSPTDKSLVASQTIGSDGSIMTALSNFYQHYISGQGVQDVLINEAVNTLLSLNGAISRISASLNSLTNSLTTFIGDTNTAIQSIYTKFNPLLVTDTWHIVGDSSTGMGTVLTSCTMVALSGTTDVYNFGSDTIILNANDRLKFKFISKDIVQVTGCVKFGDNDTFADLNISVLPQAYRPKNHIGISFSASQSIVAASGNTIKIPQGYINPAGEINFHQIIFPQHLFINTVYSIM